MGILHSETAYSGLGAGKKLILAVATNAVLLVGAELCIRVFSRPAEKRRESPVEFVGNDRGGRFPTESDPDVFWRIPANAQIPDLRPCVEENVNSHGFRGPDFKPAKEPETKRIVFLGDSNTFGMGVEGDETYVHRIRRWLQGSRTAKWEAINTAVPGYSSFQMLRMLESRVSSYSPDIVVIYAGAWNDYTPAIGLSDEQAWAQMQKSGRGPGNGPLGDIQLFHSICNVLRPRGNMAFAATSRPSKQEEYRRLWSERMERPDGPRVEKESFQRNLVTIARKSRQWGAKVIFITPPAPFKTRTRFTDGDDYARIVNETGAAECDAVVNARDVLLTKNETEDKLLFCDIIHPTPEGHARIAQALSAALLKLNIPGLPRIDSSVFTNPPIDLKELQATADNYVSEKMSLVDAGIAYDTGGVEKVIVGPPPYRVVYKSLRLPANPCIRCNLGLFNKTAFPGSGESKPSNSATFELRISEAGGPEKVVFNITKKANGIGDWTGPFAYRIDLAEFSEKTVNLILECRSDAAGASWGHPQIHACR